MVAGFSFYLQLDRTTKQSEQLVKQISQSASRTSAIAAYLNDRELGSEIVIGLANNDLIASAMIETIADSPAIISGKIGQTSAPIYFPLYSPFIEDEVVGLLVVYPNFEYIENQALASSLKTAQLLMVLSVSIAIIVGLFMRKNLTLPLRKLSDQFAAIDTSAPEKMLEIDINYKSQDEIGILVNNVNVLITLLKKQFLSEKQLRISTEELQKRFRLLFEQATAGIGLLDISGLITIANPAFNELFGNNTEGKLLSSYLIDPNEFEKRIQSLFNTDLNKQIEIDLVTYKGTKKRYLHCLLSTINESREEVRSQSQDLSQHLIEVIIYDVTSRREREIKTRYEADHDSLTGLLNRRAGTKALIHQLDKVDVNLPYFVLMMIDLDNFKPINDTYGHDVGDIVLEKVSERLSHSLVTVEGSCIRWGGDEFLLGLNLTDIDELEESIKRLLTTIEREVFINKNLRVSVGASIGAILLSESNQHSVNIDSLIAQADKVMYDTKQNRDPLVDNFLIIDYVDER